MHSKPHQQRMFGTVWSMLGAIVVMLGGSMAHAAGMDCYDFSGLPVDKEYHLKDTVDARHSHVVFKQFFVTTDRPSEQENPHATVVSSSIPKGESPSLNMFSINAHVTPKTPVKGMRLKYAINSGGAYVQNIEVNGQKLVLQGGLEQLNHQSLGQVDIATTEEDGGGNWRVGTLELRPAPGKAISSFSFGGNSQFVVDDVCIKK